MPSLWYVSHDFFFFLTSLSDLIILSLIFKVANKVYGHWYICEWWNLVYIFIFLCRLLGSLSKAVLNTNLYSSWHLLLFIGFLKSWKLLNQLYHLHLQYVKKEHLFFLFLFSNVTYRGYGACSLMLEQLFQFVCVYPYLWYLYVQEDGEDSGRGIRMGKRLLRSLALVFGCIAVISLVLHLCPTHFCSVSMN